MQRNTWPVVSPATSRGSLVYGRSLVPSSWRSRDRGGRFIVTADMRHGPQHGDEKQGEEEADAEALPEGHGASCGQGTDCGTTCAIHSSIAFTCDARKIAVDAIGPNF